jgi:16S rRNA pseudouridine516 synthase
MTMPAKVSWVTSAGVACASDHNDIDRCAFRLTIVEGKFHQVKRMLLAIGNEVVYLRRDRIGSWELEGLVSGGWKYISV